LDPKRNRLAPSRATSAFVVLTLCFGSFLLGAARLRAGINPIVIAEPAVPAVAAVPPPTEVVAKPKSVPPVTRQATSTQAQKPDLVFINATVSNSEGRVV